MVLLIAIAAVGVIAIGIGTAIQSAQAQNTCGGGFHGVVILHHNLILIS